MARYFGPLLLLCLLLPLAADDSPEEAATVYRLMHSDGRIIAYTEIMPHVGDVYWQAEEDKWYHVVRVEGDIGWLESTKTPVEKAMLDTQQVLRYLAVSVVAVGLCFWLVKLRKG